MIGSIPLCRCALQSSLQSSLQSAQERNAQKKTFRVCTQKVEESEVSCASRVPCLLAQRSNLHGTCHPPDSRHQRLPVPARPNDSLPARRTTAAASDAAHSNQAATSHCRRGAQPLRPIQPSGARGLSSREYHPSHSLQVQFQSLVALRPLIFAVRFVREKPRQSIGYITKRQGGPSAAAVFDLSQARRQHIHATGCRLSSHTEQTGRQ